MACCDAWGLYRRFAGEATYGLKKTDMYRGNMKSHAKTEVLIRELHELEAKSVIRDELVIEVEAVVEALTFRENELKAIMNGSKAVLGQQGFTESARAIFDYCKDLIGATSGYVALLNESGEENEVLFLEAGGLSCSVNPELPMPIRGLRAEAYLLKKAVYHNDFMNSEWVEFMPAGHVILKNVMFAPLIIEEKAVGLIGLANKETDFNDNDAKMAAGFGELAAIALQNSRNRDERIAAEQQREQVIEELRDALAEVKTLSGLLPICSHCQKIRDDKGYWSQIDSYIQKHSNVMFSHGICRECAEKYYPDMDIYDD